MWRFIHGWEQATCLDSRHNSTTLRVLCDALACCPKCTELSISLKIGSKWSNMSLGAPKEMSIDVSVSPDGTSPFQVAVSLSPTGEIVRMPVTPPTSLTAYPDVTPFLNRSDSVSSSVLSSPATGNSRS